MAIGQESAEARRQIVRSVMGYWIDQPGVGANVVDKLLNYSVLTPSSVIEWAFFDAGHAALSQNHVWEMVSTTVNKVNNRVRQIVAARPSLGAAVSGMSDADGAGTSSGMENEEEYAAVLAAYEATLESAKIEQKQIAEMVLRALRKIADGQGPMEGEDAYEDDVWMSLDGVQREEAMEWMGWWGGQWLKAFGRRYAIEGVIGEEEVKAMRI